MAGDLLLLQKETGFQVHDALLPRLGLLFSAAVSGVLGHAAALFIFSVVLQHFAVFTLSEFIVCSCR